MIVQIDNRETRAQIQQHTGFNQLRRTARLNHRGKIILPMKQQGCEYFRQEKTARMDKQRQQRY